MNDEDPTSSLVEHVQKAALEVIGAARACLDLAESLVKEPGDAMSAASALAAKVAPPAGGQQGAPTQRASASGGASPRVEHIEVS